MMPNSQATHVSEAAQTGREGWPALGRTQALAVLLGAALVWAYWPTLAAIVHRWTVDPRYAHGYLVPAFALVLAWMRRQPVEAGSPWAGVALVVLGSALQLLGGYLSFEWLEGIALLPNVAGLLAIWGGPRCLRWTWPSVAFLGFMVPLPFRLEMALGGPLQRIATMASTYVLQTLGFSAFGEGNIIVMERGTIGVVEACSGLSMMILFFALATGVAMVSRGPWLDRMVIVASAVPIALIANITRIVTTGVLHEVAGDKIAHVVYHDLAGWLMMPLALGLLWVVVQTLGMLLIEPKPRRQAPVVPIATAPTPEPVRKSRRGRAAKRAREPLAPMVNRTWTRP